jgi:phosphoribosyl 1,2-cyclic phosphodiesterase
MKLKVIGSSSSGNAYLLENDREALLIECGVRFEKIKQAVNYRISKIAGCIVSHEHKDHCKAVGEVLGAGINVWASMGTHKAIGTLDHRRACCAYNEGYTAPFYVGNGFKVLPFKTKHAAAEPLGFLINHEETGTVLFLTDTVYSPYTFRGLNNVIVEANYCEDILAANKDLAEKYRHHVLEGHLSIQNCKELLRANDLSQVNNIVLIHLSNGHSDEVRFKREVEELTAKNVTVADAGKEIHFGKTPF